MGAMTKRTPGNLLKRLRCIPLFVVLFSLILCTAAFGGEEEGKTVRIGYYEDEVFQEGAGEGLIKSGYAYEYYHKIAEYTGWQYEYVYGEYAELYQQIIDGKIDIIAGVLRTPEREEIISYPDRAMGLETYNLVKHDSDMNITGDPETLNGKTIGVLDSAITKSLNKYLEENGVEAEVIVYPDYVPLFKAFDNHQIDVLTAEGDGAYGRPHSELITSFDRAEYYLALSKLRPDLTEELNRAQEDLLTDEPNFINSLRSKYYHVSIQSRAFSENEKRWIMEHGEMRVGYLNNYLPYSDTDAGGKPRGIIKDIIPRMMEGLDLEGISVYFVDYTNYDEMISDLATGIIDTAFPVGGGLYITEESGVLQSGSVVSAASELVYKGEYSTETIKNAAVNENNRMQYYFVKTYYPDTEILFYPSIEDCLKAVNSGEVGYTTLNGLRVGNILRNSRYSGLSHLQTPYNDDRCFGVHKGNIGLLRLINRGIGVLGQEYAQNLAFHYADELYSNSPLDVIKNNLILFIGLILFIIILIIIFFFHDRSRARQEAHIREMARKQLDEVVSELADSRRSRKKEEEGRIALQDELMEQQLRRDQQDRMITALSAGCRGVYYVDLDHNDAVCYRGDPTDQDQSPEGIRFPYSDRFSKYARNVVTEEYRDRFMDFMNPVNIRNSLKDKRQISMEYRIKRKDAEYSETIRVSRVERPEDMEESEVHEVGISLYP